MTKDEHMQKRLRIGLIGYGKMGKAIEAAAKERGHTISAIIDPNLNNDQICEKTLSETDICIDFSRPEAVLDNIRKTAQCGKSVVVGTTGWDDRLTEVEAIVAENRIALLQAANFSIGVNLFYQIAAEAARLIDHFDEYDASVHEIHHTQKLDAPSGTALALGRLLLREMNRKTHLLNNLEEGADARGALHLTSQRCGYNPGCHTITFDSPEDTITLTHQARNRNGFAKGAVKAAEWLIGKEGIYTMDDLITSLQSEVVHG